MNAKDVNSESAVEKSADASLAAGAVTLSTLAVAFGLLALGWPYFWVAFPLGFGGAMPVAIGLARRRRSRLGERADRELRRGEHRDRRSGARERAERRSAGRGDADEALATLETRYVRGELDDAEFETRVERILETGSPVRANTAAPRQSPETDGEPGEDIADRSS